MSQQSCKTTPGPFAKLRHFGRQCALQYLYQCDIRGKDMIEPEDLVVFWEQMREQEEAPAGPDFVKAKAFANDLIRGVSRHQDQLDRKLEACANNWTLPRMSVVDRNILRLAAFELTHCQDTPGVAAVNEAIELAKEFGDKESSRFINGILDRLLQETKKDS